MRDKPTRVRVTTKNDKEAIYDLDEGHAMMLNPGEPILYMQSFQPPGRASDDRNLRMIEVLPWEVVASITFEYPAIEDTDPQVWVPKPQVAPLGQAGMPASYN